MLLSVIRFFRAFAKKMQRDNISAFAAHAAFYMMLSFFPFALVLLSVIKYLPFEVAEIDSFLADAIPNAIYSYVGSVIREASVAGTGIYFYVSIAMLLWSASRGFLALVRGVRTIYSRIDERNYFIQRLSSTLYTLVFTVMLLITIVLLVLGNLIYEYILILLPELSNFAITFINFRTVITMVLLFIYFLMLYKLIGNKKASWVSAMPGAVLASAGWILFSCAFSIYIDYLSNLSMTYGSLTTMVFCMLWLYFCMYIIMFGAEVNLLFCDDQIKAYFQALKCHLEAQSLEKKKTRSEGRKHKKQ